MGRQVACDYADGRMAPDSDHPEGRMTRLLICGAVIALAGCTTISPVTPLNAGTYLVRASNPGGFRTNDEMLEDAGEIADGFCEKSGKRAQVVYAHGGQSEAAATLVFRCVPK